MRPAAVFFRNFLIPDNVGNRLNLLYKLLTISSSASEQSVHLYHHSCFMPDANKYYRTLSNYQSAEHCFRRKKTRQKPGFSGKRINVLSTVGAYALCADRLSYVLPYERRGLRNQLYAAQDAEIRQIPSVHG